MAGRALVLGGGGVTGVAWELGVLAGLAEAGVNLRAADLVVGTSAGSVVGAQLACGVDIEEMYVAMLADDGAEAAERIGAGLVARYLWAMLRSRDPRALGMRIGKLAMAARTGPERERREFLEARLAVRAWPDQRLLITAVDAVSGEFAAFDRDSGVPLLDAVGASCAVPGVWPPVTINGRRWIDGGFRSVTNADLAGGYERIVVIAPITSGIGPMTSVARHAAELETRAKVAVVVPDKPARRAIGRNVLDPTRRAPAARAGRAQAAAAIDVAAVWSE